MCVSMSVFKPRPHGKWYSDSGIDTIIHMLQELGYMS